MESPAFSELKYKIWNNYFDNLVFEKEVEFNWERRLPVGRSKYEHYQKAGAILADIIKENVEIPRAAVLIIPACFKPILIFADAKYYEPSEISTISNAYQCGTLLGAPVVVDIAIDESESSYMILFDILNNKAIRIVPGKYDYETDLADEIAHLKEAGMDQDIAYLNKLAKEEKNGISR